MRQIQCCMRASDGHLPKRDQNKPFNQLTLHFSVESLEKFLLRDSCFMQTGWFQMLRVQVASLTAVGTSRTIQYHFDLKNDLRTSNYEKKKNVFRRSMLQTIDYTEYLLWPV